MSLSHLYSNSCRSFKRDWFNFGEGDVEVSVVGLECVDVVGLVVGLAVGAVGIVMVAVDSVVVVVVGIGVVR